MEYVFINAQQCFACAKSEENIKVCLSYAEEYDKKEFATEHAHAISFAALLSVSYCPVGQ